MSGAIELLLTRRSCVVKAMSGPGPNPDELELILTAGIRVPDHGKLFPWRVQVLDGEAQAVLGDVCASAYRADHPDAREVEVEMERERPGRAPVLLVVTNRIDADASIPVLEQVLSGGALCQNLLNASHALGYVAQWLSEWPVYDARVKAALGHRPEHDMIGWIHIGSTPHPPSERKRAQLADVVSHWRRPGGDVP